LLRRGRGNNIKVKNERGGKTGREIAPGLYRKKVNYVQTWNPGDPWNCATPRERAKPQGPHIRTEKY